MSDKEIKKISEGFTKGALGSRDSLNMCWVVCLPLQGYLSFCGCETKVIEGNIEINNENYHHYWLQMQDGRIIDPTANQFNELGVKMPKVYFGNKPDNYKILCEFQAA